ncbi:3-oxoacyl-ACP synthase III family protein [Amycolatopsis magusensis]|uniref:3-oxoacyl-ACP synthase III family protein n=1 Tax=Amycolatopsis magusensis TaxID=882444 RepID=UPI003C2AD970
MIPVVTGVGAALPERVVPNTAFAAIGITDEWISARTGIRERRRLEPGQPLGELALRASEGALADAGRKPSQVDQVVVATVTADLLSPGLAPELAFRLGVPQPAAMDLSAACTGFLYALDHACAMIESGRRRCVLVTAAEAASRIADPADRFTAPLFGDAAGAVVVEAAGSRCCAACAPAVVLGTDGARQGILYVDREHQRVRMRGAEVYEQAVITMADSARRVCAARGVGLHEIDLFVPHQANARIIRAVLRELAFPAERTVVHVGDTGNTSAASIPVALERAQREGLLTAGARVGMAAFGAGLTWGAALLDWKGCRHLLATA